MEINSEVTTKLQSIHIKGLFDMFDYDIEFAENENVLILTGANGFGKTQILNIIYNLFNQNFDFFKKLIFSEIKVCLSNNLQIIINKEQEIQFSFLEKNLEFCKATFIPAPPSELDRFINPPILKKNEYLNLSEQAKQILNSLKITFIEEQRLFKEYGEGDFKQFVKGLDECINHLKTLIKERIKVFLNTAQKLENSYPYRLISTKMKFSEEEYNSNFTKLSKKLKKLSNHGLYLHDTRQEKLEYKEEDAKALTVYLEDLQEKLSVFDDLLKKLELFTTILNEHRFTFKSIKIDKDEGFYIQTEQGKRLQLEDLSSGEKHELVLLYKLIFETDKNILLLIDEPEISLHITWQKEFLKDLLKIIEIQNFQAIIATHAPAIVNDRWDLVYTLERSK